jgi:hypothetical protein
MSDPWEFAVLIHFSKKKGSQQSAGLLKSSDFFIFNETRTKLQIAPDTKLASTRGTSPPTPTIKQHTKYL